MALSDKNIEDFRNAITTVGIAGKYSEHNRWEPRELTAGTNCKYLNFEHEYLIFDETDPVWAKLMNNLAAALRAIDTECLDRFTNGQGQLGTMPARPKPVDAISVRTCSLCREPVNQGRCRCVN